MAVASTHAAHFTGATMLGPSNTERSPVDRTPVAAKMLMIVARQQPARDREFSAGSAKSGPAGYRSPERSFLSGAGHVEAGFPKPAGFDRQRFRSCQKLLKPGHGRGGRDSAHTRKARWPQPNWAPPRPSNSDRVLRAKMAPAMRQASRKRAGRADNQPAAHRRTSVYEWYENSPK